MIREEPSVRKVAAASKADNRSLAVIRLGLLSGENNKLGARQVITLYQIPRAEYMGWFRGCRIRDYGELRLTHIRI